MKFIISEHRLDKLIYSFIDEHVKDMFNRALIDSFIVYSQDTEDEFEDKSVKIEYDYFDGKLYIEDGFIGLISDMFGLHPTEAMVKIHDWFEDYEGIRAKYLESWYKGKKHKIDME